MPEEGRPVCEGMPQPVQSAWIGVSEANPNVTIERSYRNAGVRKFAPTYTDYRQTFMGIAAERLRILDGFDPEALFSGVMESSGNAR